MPEEPDEPDQPDAPDLTPEADHDGVSFTRLDLGGRDGSGSRFFDCVVEACTLDGTTLRRSRVVDTAFRGVGASTSATPA